MDLGSALLVGVALMLVMEGLMPFLAPRLWRETFARLLALPDTVLRMGGLASMIAGVLLLAWVR